MPREKLADWVAHGWRQLSAMPAMADGPDGFPSACTHLSLDLHLGCKIFGTGWVVFLTCLQSSIQIFTQLAQDVFQKMKCFVSYSSELLPEGEHTSTLPQSKTSS